MQNQHLNDKPKLFSEMTYVNVYNTEIHNSCDVKLCCENKINGHTKCARHIHGVQLIPFIKI